MAASATATGQMAFRWFLLLLAVILARGDQIEPSYGPTAVPSAAAPSQKPTTVPSPLPTFSPVVFGGIAREQGFDPEKILREAIEERRIIKAREAAAVPPPSPSPPPPPPAALKGRNNSSSTASSDLKLAFLFMARGHMPLEDVWREFFRWKADASRYTIYVHTHVGFKFPVTSFFHGRQLEQMEDGRLWGSMGQVRAIKRLVRAALGDPLNAWFLMMSESCIPLHPFSVFYKALLSFNKSVVNACDFGAKEMETDTRWRPGLDEVGLKKSDWRKSATWFAMMRKHAAVFTHPSETVKEKGWEKVPCCDEHYLPTLLAHHGLDNETTCSDGFVHVHWRNNIDSHPYTYAGEDITPDLFRHLNEPVNAKEAGFGLQCSGVPGMCHFTARKFSGAYKYQLLENLDLLLSDDEGGQYEGNPWDHHQDKMRLAVEGGTNVYYLIENGLLRQLPDNETIRHMHLEPAKARPLDAMDTTAFHKGPPFPSRRDGQFVRHPKSNWVFYIKDGRRHGVPNLDTFFSLNATMANIKVISYDDLSSIVLGEPLPDAKKLRPHGH